MGHTCPKDGDLYTPGQAGRWNGFHWTCLKCVCQIPCVHWCQGPEPRDVTGKANTVNQYWHCKAVVLTWL